MRTRSNLFFTLVLVLIVFTRVAYSVPHEFCLDTFNGDDCGQAPTAMFYYYKPGSRCEIRLWKGCPTLNKFPNFFSCLHFCVMRIWGDGGAAMIEAPEDPKEEWIEDLNELDVEDMDIIDQLLTDVVEHNHQKLALHKSPETVEDTEYIEEEEAIMSEGEPDEVIIT